jgi:sugar phosphate isomerase/epimerase
MVVKKLGLHNIEPLDAHFRATEPVYLAELREATEKAGARVIDVPVDLHDSFYDTDPARRAKSVEASRKWIDIANTLGSSSVHMKDSEVGEDGKVRTVDFANCFAIAKTAGYRGYFSMEWEGKGEPYAGTQQLIDETLKNLA